MYSRSDKIKDHAKMREGNERNKKNEKNVKGLNLSEILIIFKLNTSV